MREAEVKHARLAMLAAAGWPLSELLDGPLSTRYATQSECTNNGQTWTVASHGAKATCSQGEGQCPLGSCEGRFSICMAYLPGV